MKILIVGGTGLIGGHAALHLHAQGNPVTLAARKAPTAGSALAQFDVLQRDYVAGNFTRDDLAPFDAVVFAAGNDIRHLPPGTDEAAHWERANVDAVPRFFALTRDAGVKRAVLVGSFYPQVAPALVDTVPYVRSRHLADERVRALATPSFAVCSVNASFVVGSVPGLRNEMFAAYTGY
ncbi:NAD(P)-dependent oxidoreductase, partial [Burkholderia sp.]